MGVVLQAAESMEFIHVSPDGWNFETAHSHKRFIPFGANLTFDEPDNPTGWSFSILTGPIWDPVKLRKLFEGAHAANMNLMKVFLPSNQIIPDPQNNANISFPAMTPPIFERLDALFQIAHDNNIYISLTLAEWGLHENQWFEDGGIFFGRQPEDGPGTDSFSVYRNFWVALAERYKNEPALFSYNLAVEYLIPSIDWGGQKSKDLWYMFNDRWGLPRWHKWLLEQYGNLVAINAAWGKSYAGIDDIPQPEIVWQGSKYSMPQAMIADYNSFKEWTSYRFLRNQADAIHSVDKGHMITCGLHQLHPAVGWVGSAMYLPGPAPTELDFLDYTTVHAYSSPASQQPGQGPYDIARQGAILTARFAHYPGKPLIAEEFGHIVQDYQESQTETFALVYALVGHVSGFQLWNLEKTRGYFGPLGPDAMLNDMGREWKKLAEPGGVVANLPLTRTPSHTIIKLERLSGMCPMQHSQYIEVQHNWDAYQQPVDFDWPLNPAIAKIRPEPVRALIPLLHWNQY